MGDLGIDPIDQFGMQEGLFALNAQCATSEEGLELGDSGSNGFRGGLYALNAQRAM
jgi:hypothetical protein